MLSWRVSYRASFAIELLFGLRYEQKKMSILMKAFLPDNAFPVTTFDILFQIYQASVFSKEFSQPFRAHFQKRLTRVILANFVLQKAAKRFSHRFSFCRCTHNFRNFPHAFSVLFFASCREIFRIPRLQICRK
jgi:hypothetical protein